MTWHVFASLASAVVLAGHTSATPNMNGDYLITQTPNGGSTSKFPTSYADYPGGAEYFDIYSPEIRSTYAEIFWTRFDPVPLPPEVVKRFDGKAMAVIGLEWDQVRTTPDGEDVSVPMSVTYNHHYTTHLLGKQSSLARVAENDARVPAYPAPAKGSDGKVWVVEDQNPASEWPNSQAYYSQNGGEARKSFKGYAPGFARMVMSPQNFSMEVMQIDTWNRDAMNLTGSPFVAGPLPKNALSPEGAQYSGLLECPLTTRVRKVIPGLYKVVVSGDCGELKVSSEAECYAAAAQFAPPGFNVSVTTVVTPDLPPGCSVSLLTETKVIAGSFNTQNGVPGLAKKMDKDKTTGTALCGQNATGMSGSQESLVAVAVALDEASATATIQLTGPDGLWFGVGFGATTMSDEPWAIIVDGYGNVTERKLALYAPGSLLSPSVTVVSNTVSHGNRSVTLTRSLAGEVFSFDLQTTEIPFINAIGTLPDLVAHASKSVTVLTMLASGPGAASCICTKQSLPFGKGTGSLRYEDGQQVNFQTRCHDDVLAQRNPTCDIRTYAGGIQCCLNGWRLLDADQDVPWQDQPLVYRHKYRFWFQEYDQQRIKQQPVHISWTMGAVVGEYDIPKCPAGTPNCTGVHTLTGTHLIPEENKYAVAIKSHCHAATCISIQIYFNDTGELICDQRSVFGQGGLDKFGEPGYINRPPCLFGPAEFGLEPPPLIGGRVLKAVALTNSTYGHHGEMAIPVFFTVAEPLNSTV